MGVSGVVAALVAQALFDASAGESEKQLLLDLWEAQTRQNKDQHANKIAAQLLLGLNKLLKHQHRQPPQVWQPLATAVLTALLAELDDEDAEPSEGAGSAVGAAKGDAVEEVPEPVPDTAGEEPEPPPDTPTFDAAAEASESSLKIFAVEKGGEANEDKNPPDTHQVRT